MAWKICGIAFVLLLVIAVGILRSKAQSQKSSADAMSATPEKAMAAYLGLRNLALSKASAEKEQPSKTDPNDPLAVLMDMSLTPRTVTVVAYADGTASIYMSNGGGFLGGGQKYASIREAAHKMLATAHQLQSKMQITKQFPLPEKGEITFYLVTTGGVYTVRAPRAKMGKKTQPLTELFAAGEEIITQYRLNVAKQ